MDKNVIETIAASILASGYRPDRFYLVGDAPHGVNVVVLESLDELFDFVEQVDRGLSDEYETLMDADTSRHLVEQSLLKTRPDQIPVFILAWPGMMLHSALGYPMVPLMSKVDVPRKLLSRGKIRRMARRISCRRPAA